MNSMNRTIFSETSCLYPLLIGIPIMWNFKSPTWGKEMMNSFCEGSLAEWTSWKDLLEKQIVILNEM